MEEVEEEDHSIEVLYNEPFGEKIVNVLAHTVPHIIGREGQAIRQIKFVCGFFLTLRDLGDGNHEFFIIGP